MMYFNAKDVYDLIEECKYMETHMSTRPGHLVLDVNKFKDKLGHLAGSGTDFGIDSNTSKFYSQLRKVFSASASRFIRIKVNELFGTDDLSVILKDNDYELFTEGMTLILGDIMSTNRTIVMGEELINNTDNEICLAMCTSPEGNEKFEGLCIDGKVYNLTKCYWKSTGKVYEELAELLNNIRAKQDELNAVNKEELR